MTKQFLNEEKKQLKHIILELGELHEMDDDDLEVANEKFFNHEILNIENEIKTFYDSILHTNSVIEETKKELNKLKKPTTIIGLIFGKKIFKDKINSLEGKLINLTAQKWDDLGIENWSKTLYHSFD